MRVRGCGFGVVAIRLRKAPYGLGHSTIAITADLSSHTSAVHDREAPNALGDLLAGTETGPKNEPGARDRDLSVTNGRSA